MLILLVDDDTANRTVTRRQLSHLGYEVHDVADGESAVEAIRRMEGQYALILMDCQMPGINGYKATRLIREIEAEQGGHIPIVAMTASAVREIREQYERAGMDDYILKPVTLQSLRDLMERWIKKNP